MDTEFEKESVTEVDANHDLGHDKDLTVVATTDSVLFGAPLRGNRDLVNFKGMLVRRLLENEEEKVGLVRSSSGPGRFAQGVASFVTPGDMSGIRSPIRSRVYSAITPGGGGSRIGGTRRLLGAAIGRDKKPEVLRCPAGFENGGRFATRGFANCGRRLFDLPGGSNGLTRGNLNLVGLLSREGELVGRGRYEGRTIQVERNAQIPRVGGANLKDQNGAVLQAVAALSANNTAGSLMIRRDAQMLRPTVSASVLSTIKKNPDMQDAVLVSSVSDPSKIGSSEVPAIWNSGLRSVAFALPGGGSLSIERTRVLTAGDKRRLGRAWGESTNVSDGQFDYGIRLRRLAENSNGSLKYNESFPSIDKPNDLLTISEIENQKNTASVRRWVFSSYLSDNAPGRGESKPWKEISTATEAESVDAGVISNVADAVKHLDANGNPETVPAEYLGSALAKAKSFRSTKTQPGVTLLERADGKRWYRKESDAKFSHLSERVSSDINAALGLQSPPVKFIGTGDRRDVLIAHPENGVDAKVKRSTIGEMDNADLLRISISDWLLDHENRDPSSLVAVGRGDKQRVISTSNGLAALAGLSSDELNARRRQVLDEYFKSSRNSQIAAKYADISASQRKILLGLFDDMLKRANEFNWDDYTTRLGLDGRLTPGEKAHLELIKALYSRRLGQLRSQKKRYLSLVGVE
jgi:hypothetical protein